MKLYEYEGKELFKKSGIDIPIGVLLDNTDDFSLTFPVAIKAQVLTGKRGKSGLIRFCEDKEKAKSAIKGLLTKTNKVLVEEKLEIKNEHYLSITYDTRTRSPVVVACRQGGIDIEEFKEKNPDKVIIEPIDLNIGLVDSKEILKHAGFEAHEVLIKLFECFKTFDCKLAEINPLVETKDGRLIAADAKIILDDDAMFRHKDLNIEERQLAGRALTSIEKKAREIDKDDHRGTAGSTFIELDGDIAILASGGGASLTCMDALLAYGAKPANYTEYSGNPPAEKVEKLTRVTLSKPGLNGCWVCGGTANFTDIYETLGGFLEGLRQTQPKPDYPIVIRRAGPRDKEAFEMLRKAAKEEGWDFHIYGDETPMTKTAEIIVEKVKEYKVNKSIVFV